MHKGIKILSKNLPFQEQEKGVSPETNIHETEKQFI